MRPASQTTLPIPWVDTGRWAARWPILMVLAVRMAALASDYRCAVYDVRFGEDLLESGHAARHRRAGRQGRGDRRRTGPGEQIHPSTADLSRSPGRWPG